MVELNTIDASKCTFMIIVNFHATTCSETTAATSYAALICQLTSHPIYINHRINLYHLRQHVLSPPIKCFLQ